MLSAELAEKIAAAVAAQKAELEALRREKNAAKPEALKLKGELVSQKAAYEVTAKDLEMSYKLLAGAQSLFEKRSGKRSDHERNADELRKAWDQAKAKLDVLDAEVTRLSEKHASDLVELG